MLPRLLVAVIGGFAVTIALLLGMNEATRHFKDTDPNRYFTIVDFISAPAGSRRPRPPPAPSAQPDRPDIGYQPGNDARVGIDRPALEERPLTPEAPQSPSLDPPTEDPAQ